jgi:hypothetical protein
MPGCPANSSGALFPRMAGLAFPPLQGPFWMLGEPVLSNLLSLHKAFRKRQITDDRPFLDASCRSGQGTHDKNDLEHEHLPSMVGCLKQSSKGRRSRFTEGAYASPCIFRAAPAGQPPARCHAAGNALPCLILRQGAEYLQRLLNRYPHFSVTKNSDSSVGVSAIRHRKSLSEAGGANPNIRRSGACR